MLVCIQCAMKALLEGKPAPSFEETHEAGIAGRHDWRPPAAAQSAVHHPKHYNAHPAGIECIDVVEHMTFNLGNAVKYLWRNGLKDQTPAKEDLEKAIWYIQRELERVELEKKPEKARAFK